MSIERKIAFVFILSMMTIVYAWIEPSTYTVVFSALVTMVLIALLAFVILKDNSVTVDDMDQNYEED